MRNKGNKFSGADEAQVSFENIKLELSEKGMFVWDTDLSVLNISGIIYQERERSGRTVPRPISFASKVLLIEHSSEHCLNDLSLQSSRIIYTGTTSKYLQNGSAGKKCM